MLLCALVLLVSSVSFAQLKVNSNTTFTIKDVVSSKAEANIFYSSVLGDDQLVLNGKNQYLETAEAVSLPSLRLADGGELRIITQLKLRDNLIVESGVLKLEKPVYVDGEVILENQAAIDNKYFLIYQNSVVFQKDATTATVSEWHTTVLFIERSSANTTTASTFNPTGKFTNSNDSIQTQFRELPSSPPPEVA
jgi:Tfp pilus assembly protein FimT